MSNLTTNLSSRLPAVKADNEVNVITINDLPQPSSGLITLADNTIYTISTSLLELGGSRLALGDNCHLCGRGPSFTTKTCSITSTSSGTMITAPGSTYISIKNLALETTGSTLMDLTLDSGIQGGICDISDSWMVSGDIILTDGAVFSCRRTQINSKVTFPSGAGFARVDILDGCFIYDRGGVIDGQFDFLDGSEIGLVTVKEANFDVFNAGTSIFRFRDTSITQFVFKDNAIRGSSDTKLLVSRNPDLIESGVYANNLSGGIQEFGLLPVPDSQYPINPGQASSARDICEDADGNSIMSTQASGIFRYVGFSSTLDSSIIGPGTSVHGIAWYRGDLYSADLSTDQIYRHDGFSDTILESISSAAWGGTAASGITFAGENLISTDTDSDTVYIHDGFSTTILDSFLISCPSPFYITYDGLNLMAYCSTQRDLIVYKGLSGQILYTINFGSGFDASSGISATSFGFARINSTDNIEIYNHRFSFDHSAPSWFMADNRTAIETNFIPPSIDRGGSEFYFDSPLPVVSGAIGEWMDVSGAGIFYGQFEECEKMRMSNDLNGEILIFDAEENSLSVSGQISINRAGGGNVDIFYELAVSINGQIEKDSITRTVLPANNSFGTLTTIPVSKLLDPDDTIKLQYRNITNIQAINCFIAKLAIS